ncbi:hypothetical protein CBER1_11972 [Cercospora berteroae]|uniref:Uncharacterized protein n=1 Tax=Cercospora berteroae TaxID=357750 RepID=A0A2S6CNP6_9PEZI|nr:hypothetical protein CBER1_11972 [Cercospora berteroae]
MPEHVVGSIALAEERIELVLEVMELAIKKDKAKASTLTTDANAIRTMIKGEDAGVTAAAARRRRIGGEEEEEVVIGLPEPDNIGDRPIKASRKNESSNELEKILNSLVGILGQRPVDVE